MASGFFDKVQNLSIKSVSDGIARRLKPKQQEEKIEPVQIANGLFEGISLLISKESLLFKQTNAGSYEDGFTKELSKAAETIQQGHILDIGGHIGLMALLFAKKSNEAVHVISFEPNVYNVEHFHENLKLNKRFAAPSRIKIENIALFDEKTTKRFSFSKNIHNNTSSGSHLKDVDAPLSEAVYAHFGFEEVEVQCISLDEYCASNNISDITMMKVDVEGAELNVLKGAVGVLRSQKPLVFVEIHNAKLSHDVVVFLKENGYTTRVIEFDSQKPYVCHILATAI